LVPFERERLTALVCRELAFQIAEQFLVLGKSINVKVSTVVGGMGTPVIVLGLHGA
jgi:hypothetical protein